MSEGDLLDRSCDAWLDARRRIAASRGDHDDREVQMGALQRKSWTVLAVLALASQPISSLLGRLRPVLRKALPALVAEAEASSSNDKVDDHAPSIEAEQRHTASILDAAAPGWRADCSAGEAQKLSIWRCVGTIRAVLTLEIALSTLQEGASVVGHWTREELRTVAAQVTAARRRLHHIAEHHVEASSPAYELQYAPAGTVLVIRSLLDRAEAMERSLATSTLRPRPTTATLIALQAPTSTATRGEASSEHAQASIVPLNRRAEAAARGAALLIAASNRPDSLSPPAVDVAQRAVTAIAQRAAGRASSNPSSAAASSAPLSLTEVPLRLRRALQAATTAYPLSRESAIIRASAAEETGLDWGPSLEPLVTIADRPLISAEANEAAAGRDDDRSLSPSPAAVLRLEALRAWPKRPGDAEPIAASSSVLVNQVLAAVVQKEPPRPDVLVEVLQSSARHPPGAVWAAGALWRASTAFD